jgi:uncharacterized phage protein (TIGR01671 family)
MKQNMDRFKFRCFDKKQKIMIDLEQETGGFILRDILENEDYILMQCTGLKDKNSKLIYEGDIVECIFEDWQGNKPKYKTKVEFIEGYYWHIDGLDNVNLFENSLKVDGKIDCEIIGNLYENPELLKN